MQNQLTSPLINEIELLIMKEELHMVVENWAHKKTIEFVIIFYEQQKQVSQFKLSARTYLWIKSCNKILLFTVKYSIGIMIKGIVIPGLLLQPAK